MVLAGAAISLNRFVTPAMVLTRYDVFRAYVDGHFASALLIYMACYLAAASLSLPGARAADGVGRPPVRVGLGGRRGDRFGHLGAIIVFIIARSASVRFSPGGRRGWWSA